MGRREQLISRGRHGRKRTRSKGPVENGKLNLSLVSTVRLDFIRLETDLSGDVDDGLGGLSGGDGNVTAKENDRRVKYDLKNDKKKRLELANSPRDVLEHMEGVPGDVPLPSLIEVSLSRLVGVLHELGDGHGSNSSRDWGDEGRDLGGGGEVNISDESLAGLLGGVYRWEKKR